MNKVSLIVYPAKELAGTSRYLVSFWAQNHMQMGLTTQDTRWAICRLALIQNAGPVTYIDVADIKSSLQEMLALGATLQQDVKDVAKGLLVASVKDKDGNILGFRQNPQ